MKRQPCLPTTTPSYPDGHTWRRQRRLLGVAILAGGLSSGCDELKVNRTAGDMPAETGDDGLSQVEVLLPEVGSRTLWLYSGDDWIDYHLAFLVEGDDWQSDLLEQAEAVLAAADAILVAQDIYDLVDGADLSALEDAVRQAALEALERGEGGLVSFTLVIDNYGIDEAVPGDMG